MNFPIFTTFPVLETILQDIFNCPTTSKPNLYQNRSEKICEKKELNSEQLKIIYFRKKIANVNLQRKLMFQKHNLEIKYYTEKIAILKST